MTTLTAERNHRVIVIDDNRAIHEDFRKILAPAPATTGDLAAAEAALFGSPEPEVTGAQFEVHSAYQGQEGLDMIKQAVEENRPYALAFVDVRMPPGWDGIETTQRLW